MSNNQSEYLGFLENKWCPNFLNSNRMATNIFLFDCLTRHANCKVIFSTEYELLQIIVAINLIEHFLKIIYDIHMMGLYLYGIIDYAIFPSDFKCGPYLWWNKNSPSIVVHDVRKPDLNQNIYPLLAQIFSFYGFFEVFLFYSLTSFFEEINLN